MKFKTKRILGNIAWVALVVSIVSVLLFIMYKTAEEEKQKTQEREDYIRKETTCELSAGVMIDDICYKQDKLETIEVG